MLGFDLGTGHAAKMASDGSNGLWRLRDNTAFSR
jgi:hypothetical protein